MSEWTGLSGDLFLDEAISDETRAVIELVEAISAQNPPIENEIPAEIRKQRREGKGAFPKPVYSDRATTRTIPGPGGEINLRIIAPENPKGALLYIHGGGWTLGALDAQDPLLEVIADNADLACVSVGYRLAPEHPYPAAPDDCEAAALWFVENAQKEFGTDRLLISGPSAGAHLSLVTMLRLRDRHGMTPFCGADLTYGGYDLTMSPSQRNWGDRRLILNTPILQWFRSNFLPADKFDTDAKQYPDISPIFADLTGLPPALFTVGTMDPLLDDTLSMYARWIAAGNEAQLEIVPGGIHAFNLFPSKITTDHKDRMLAFLNACGQ